ncbi:MAG: SDR family oxidoreductase [Chloroflexota bacterium]
MAEVEAILRGTPSRWLVTGAAGFIGSHLVERLLQLGQVVVGLDNFATGSARNLDDVLRSVAAAGDRFALIEGDIRDQATCRRACQGVDVILHQAALGSVPRSIDDPATTNAVNVDGFLNMLVAARDAQVRRFVYASSSAVYGDDPRLPKREGNEGTPLSPYAVTKVANELYAGAFQRAYGLEVIGLRYFNVFGTRQDPDGPYAAVIPRWIGALMRGDPCTIYGDGETSRDFCYVANVVQANVLAAQAAASVTGGVYNVAYGRSTTLNGLYLQLRDHVQRLRPGATLADKVHEPFRQGDVRHSLASVRRTTGALGYRPTHDLARGLDEAMPWYAARVV